MGVYSVRLPRVLFVTGWLLTVLNRTVIGSREQGGRPIDYTKMGLRNLTQVSSGTGQFSTGSVQRPFFVDSKGSSLLTSRTVLYVSLCSSLSW